MSSTWGDAVIEAHRLEWTPEDTRKASDGGSLLGEGTFGSVYRGEMDGDRVAIKVIKAPRGPDGSRPSQGRKAAEEQHAREIRRLMRLRFRHVVQCYGVSRHPQSNELLIITECLNGGSLHAALEDARIANAPLSNLSFLTVAAHIAKGLLYIHNSGFIHGDVKPHNVLLNANVIIDHRTNTAYFPGHVEAKVADFGMSKRLKNDEEMNLAMSTAEFGNQPFGTYAYMAPESFNGVSTLDDEQLKAVDVFAFGVLIYELLSGMSPWKYEGVATPMQLQRLVCFEGRRPNWGHRQIPDEYKHLVDSCWHDDSRRRPTTKTLKTTFDRWLKEERLQNGQTNASSSTIGPSSEASQTPDIRDVPSATRLAPSVPQPEEGRRPRTQTPPKMPTTPTDLQPGAERPGGGADADEDRGLTRVESELMSPTTAERERGRAAGAAVVKRKASRQLAEPQPDPPHLPMSPSAEGTDEEDAESTNSSVSEVQRINTGDLPSINGSGDYQDSDEQEEDDDDENGAMSAPYLSSGDDLDARRKYWEKRGPSVQTMQVTPPTGKYSIGDSVANMVGPASGQPGQQHQHQQQPSANPSSGSGDEDGGDGLEYSVMADAMITRVETQPFKQPERPGLELGGLALPSADIFNTGTAAGPGGEVKWGSMLAAVERQNKSTTAEQPGSVAPAVGALREKFENLGTDGADSATGSHARAGAGEEIALPALRQRSSSSPEDDVFAAMGVAVEPPHHRRTVSTPEGETAKPEDEQKQPNGHAGGSVHAQEGQTRPAQQGYVAPARQQTAPNRQQPGPPTYRGPPVQAASSVHDSQKQLSIADVLQMLQAPDGVAQVTKWFDDGNLAVVAEALQRDDCHTEVPTRVKLLIDLLRKTTVSESILKRKQMKSPTNSSVAKALCIALGNIFRGGLGDQKSAEGALPTTLQTMQAFTWDMNVYSAACYALANVMKVSNEIADERVRRDVADWISHATSFNLNNNAGGPEPMLAYTTAAAARSFVWRREENAKAFFARREAQNVVHASAAENMCKSMLYFQPDAMVVEHCLSAFAALAFFPAHRTSLVAIGTVGAAQRVMERASITKHEQVMTTGLAFLGILVAHSASPGETKQIVDALINESGVRVVVQVLQDAARARNFRAMEEGLAALAAMARFDSRLSGHIVQKGGVSPVIQTVFCYVQGAPELLKPRAAEVMCDVADVLSQNNAAASMMRQTGLSQPLGTLVHRFGQEPRVTSPGRQAIGRIQ